MVLLLRSNRETPRISSIFFMDLVSAGCDTASSSAAFFMPGNKGEGVVCNLLFKDRAIGKRYSGIESVKNYTHSIVKKMSLRVIMMSL